MSRTGGRFCPGAANEASIPAKVGEGVGDAAGCCMGWSLNAQAPMREVISLHCSSRIPIEEFCAVVPKWGIGPLLGSCWNWPQFDGGVHFGLHAEPDHQR